MKGTHLYIAIILLAATGAGVSTFPVGGTGNEGLSIGTIFVPPVVPVMGDMWVLVNVSCQGDLPANASLMMEVTDPFGSSNRTTVDLVTGPFHEYNMLLDPTSPGRHGLEIGITSDDGVMPTMSFDFLAVMPDLYQDWEAGSDWSMRGSDPSFHRVLGDGRSPSGGYIVSIGSGTGPYFEPGFAGAMSADIIGPLMDLTACESGTLYIYQSRAFLGPDGSCGGWVEAKIGNRSVILVPDGGYDTTLNGNITGGSGERRALSGQVDWSLSRFDLAPVVGSTCRIGISASSGPEGYGNWTIDDIIVVLAGSEDTTPPGPVSDLVADPGSDGSVLLSWTPPADADIAGFYVYISPTGIENVSGEVPYATILPDGEMSYTLSDLDAGEHWAAVAAFDAAGNVHTSVTSVRFTVSGPAPNRPPVASIAVQASPPYYVGEEISFSASGSSDPDGDAITCSWTLPDGTRRLGTVMVWTPTEAGDARIVLSARDRWGATNETSTTIEIERGGDGPIIKGDLLPFLIVVVPLAIAMLFVLSAIALIRARRRRKLELDLEEVGIVHRPQFERQCQPGKAENRVVDLRPVGKGHHERSKAPAKADGRHTHKRQPYSIPPPPIPPKEKQGPPSEHRPDHGESHPNVNVTLECSCCGKTFRHRVRKGGLGARPLMVRCPHCGSEGEV